MRLRQIVEEFEYDDLIKEMWREKLSEAKKEFNIDFSDENDEDVAERVITIDQNQWEHTKCRFNCQLRSAGGDWQNPLLYFRCQTIDGYAKGHNTYSDSQHFIFIPDKKQGNSHLTKTKSGWSAPDHEGSKDEDKPNERQCWKSLKEYLTKLVEDEIKAVKSGEV